MTRWLLAALAVASGRCVLAAETAAIPFKQDGSGAAAAVPGGALGVLLLSALAIVVVLVVRKRLNLVPGGAAGAPRLLRVLETQRLGPRAVLSVVEFEGRRHVIAQTEQGVHCLLSAPDAPPQEVQP